MVFSPADILLPNGADLTRWAVVACDQYTAQPDYWARVDAFVGAAPSTLRLVLPEGRLEQPGVDEAIAEIHAAMGMYVNKKYFTKMNDTILYLERTLEHGGVRRGLIGKVDLEAYDYHQGAKTPIRATEGTVLERIPPRVAVRAAAPVELPHVMLLMDDPTRQVIEPLAQQKTMLDKVYDFTLMERGGRLAAWRLDAAQTARVIQALEALADPAAFHARYGLPDQPVFVFAAGDGNHSLATAKEHYERLKKTLSPHEARSHPARWALVELVNLYDDALEFEPIHRVVFDTEPEALLQALIAAHPGAHCGAGTGHVLRYAHASGAGEITVPDPAAQLPVGTLQRFLDDYTAQNGGRIDYIHGDDVAERLGTAPGAVAFFLPAMDKTALFPTVIHDGALPRKTFSMGHAHEKRFYMEARAIL